MSNGEDELGAEHESGNAEGEGAGQPAADDQEAARIHRRAALKVALGGAAAAAAFTAPRIEGMSIVPDYAAAATCVTTSASPSPDSSVTVLCVAGCGTIFVNYNCWGEDNLSCGCTAQAFAARSVNLGGQTVTMNATANGKANTKSNCSSSGSLSVNIGGRNRGSCTVQYSIANCTGANAVGTLTFNTNGNQNAALFCASNSDTNRTASLTLTCNC